MWDYNDILCNIEDINYKGEVYRELSFFEV